MADCETCERCGADLHDGGVLVQQSNTHRDWEETWCYKCATEEGYDPFDIVLRDSPPPVCPSCGAPSSDFNYGSISIEDKTAQQEAWCGHCDCEWTEIYNFAGYGVNKA